MTATERTKEYRLFGLPEEGVRQRLAEMPHLPLPRIDYTCTEEETVLTLTSSAPMEQALEQLENAEEWLSRQFGVYLYSRDGSDLPARVVRLLDERGKTLATAESCTGGLMASRLTGVPGCSKVFHTGVVSYSCDCKQKLLTVSEETLTAHGAVSAETAGEMARGVRRLAGADLGVAITGEAGPHTAEDHPVGTVFVALADNKRTWVKELHLDAPGRDRDGIRRVAASHGLDLVRRYLEAWPAVMAGGQPHRSLSRQREIPRTKGPRAKRLLARLLPWRGDPLGRLLAKSALWLTVLALMVGGVLAGYRYLLAPGNNQDLQTSLGELYWGGTSDLTVDTAPSGAYPAGMMTQFRGLYDINADVCGWIRIPDTAIDYPVMAYRNGYYQNHSFMDQYSVYGQPYFDGDNLISPLAADRTTTIYGKNTEDGQMFSSLLSYRRIAYLRERSVIEMNTLFTAAQWEIFAVLVADERNKQELDYARVTFGDDGDFEAYIADLRERSLFHADCTVTAEDRILLLSTDAQEIYGFSGARLVVAARLLTGGESAASYHVNYGVRMPAAMYRDQPTTKTRTTTTTATRPQATTTRTTVNGDNTTQTSTTAATTTSVPTSTTVPTTIPTTTTGEVDSTTTATTLAAEETQPTQNETTHKTEIENDADIGN